MLINHLLNPEGENTEAARVWSNEEIFELIKEESRQESDNSNEPTTTKPPVKRPTKTEMLRHVSQALLYLEDQPKHDNLIANLEEFQQELLKAIHFGGTQAEIKDYFKPVAVPNSTSQPKSNSSAAKSPSTSKALPDDLTVINHVE
ncbi:hypothetical protein PtA15_12A553 [Puccinia triticina]|uniref:Uncharacterized protein n=1 Tax=Puccinia triticina TaxID=208348 RepID=A0ABY7CZ19_9BASI|nr:uncharacterized protein PtA15_12A553 [Puccinia triticina]WAQ90563.1 hypothetical protein PtA15_12A553 [Puccinia triticina]